METNIKIKKLKELCGELDELSEGDDTFSRVLKHFRNMFLDEIERLENLSKE